MILKPALIPTVVLSMLLVTACEDTQILPEPVIDAPQRALKYDGSNVTAPQLPANSYEAAARFAGGSLGFATGTLEDVYFYILDRPSSCTIKVYEGTADNAPDSLIYSAVVSSDVVANSWNRHTLTRDVKVGAKDLWIAVKFSHSLDQRTLGCDAGPAAADGDWLLDAADGQWIKLVNRTSLININWNIRGAVTPD
ncbi:MAG: hypothetical protein SF053_21440 [Bacteroidia bacterium]|nr:hypothetical protein [Bacteroidia bacterium]